MLETPLAHKSPPASAETVSRLMRLLVIDDNVFDRQRVLRMSEKAGLAFEAVEVEGLEDLSVALDKTAYDLVFIDYLLVDATGLDALDMLLKHDNQKSAAAIMLAGEGQISIAVEAMRRGCADYLTKAMISVDALQKSVATALERRMLLAAMVEVNSTNVSFERKVQEYANACTAEMRTILAGTLRRVRKLRTYQQGNSLDYSIDLKTLELDIDRLWESLPSIKSGRMIGAPARPSVMPNKM